MDYKIKTYPRKWFSFFKYGVPYAYLNLTGKNREVVWYFNTMGELRKGKNQRYLGDKLSLKLLYIKMFKIIFKYKH